MQDAQPFRGDSDKHSHDSFCTETELHSKLHQILRDRFTNGVQNGPRNHSNSGSRDCPGALWRPPGSSWGVWGRFLTIWWRFLAKLGRRWAQDRRKMGQVGSKLRPRWAMAMLASVWERNASGLFLAFALKLYIFFTYRAIS